MLSLSCLLDISKQDYPLGKWIPKSGVQRWEMVKRLEGEEEPAKKMRKQPMG